MEDSNRTSKSVPRRPRGDGTLTEVRPGYWRLRVYAGKDPVTGRPHQASKTVRARTKTVALRELRAFAAEVDSREVVPTAATVGDLLDRWVTEFLPGEGKAPTTIESYRGVIDNHLKKALGHVLLRDLSAYHLDRYYRAKQKAGMSDRTVLQHHAILSSALTQAVRWDWMTKSPASKARPPKPPRGQGFIPTNEQVQAVIRACGDDMDLRVSVTLMAVIGLRRGELSGLKWSDVDWQQGTLLVERQRIRADGDDRTLPLKHGERRLVALGERTMAVLEHYRDHMDGRCTVLGVARLKDGWLISEDGGRTPTVANNLTKRFDALGKRAKVPGITPHALRRFAATQMVGAGVDVRTAAGRLGHNPEILLRRYAGFMPARDLAAAQGLEALVLEPPVK